MLYYTGLVYCIFSFLIVANILMNTVNIVKSMQSNIVILNSMAHQEKKTIKKPRYYYTCMCDISKVKYYDQWFGPPNHFDISMLLKISVFKILNSV
jgi:hypothetical protein